MFDFVLLSILKYFFFVSIDKNPFWGTLNLWIFFELVLIALLVFIINFNKIKKYLTWRLFFIALRIITILLVTFVLPFFVIKILTPTDYTIIIKRECDGIKCEKIIDSNIEKEINSLISQLKRLDFFARFTFLQFDFKITNKSQFKFVIDKPHYEKGIDVYMQCNLGGQNYILSPNSGIHFKQKTSIDNLIVELSNIQKILISACNPAQQTLDIINEKPQQVAPNGKVSLIYNEEKYHLKFLSNNFNYWLTALQIFIITGVILGAYYEIQRFLKDGFNWK